MGPWNGDLMFGTWEAQGASLARSAALEAQEGNSARLAFSCHHQNSSGIGHFTIASPIIFDLPFLTRPFFTEGASVKTAPPAADYGIPQGSASVWQWERNVKGHYIGAYVSLSVWVDGDGFFSQPPLVEMVHDLIFIGVGYKDLGPGVAVEEQLLAPRPVGFGGTQ